MEKPDRAPCGTGGKFRPLDRSQQRWPHFHRIFGDWLYLRSNNATAHRRYHHLDHTVLQTMTNFTTTLGDLGAFVSNIETLRGQIGWLGVIPGDDVNPVTFTANEILFENTDGTFTRIVGSGFNEIGGLHGTVSAVQHLATDATTVLPDGLSGLNLSLPTLADAISPSNLSDDFYQLAGQGANTLTGFNAQVGSTNNYYINFDA